jgi:hypothetical protein
MRTKLSVTLMLLLALTYCKQPANKNQSASNFSLSLKPPTPLVNVPFFESAVQVETGDTLFYNSSIILFPPNAFVDKDGKLVTGKVQVRYRELTDPVDFYLSGIPMNFDSAGTSYTFESSAMCELLAYQDGRPVFVNQQSQPEISIVGRSGIQGNLYYLDSTTGNWINKGFAARNKIADIMELADKGNSLNDNGNNIPPSPLKPIKANGKLPVIRVLIDSSSFAELKVYDSLQFEIDTSNQKFDPAVTNIEWNDVKFYKRGEGKYLVKFVKGENYVQYIAKPVLQGKNYDQAVIIYNNKMAEYKNLKYKRKLTEKIINDRNRKLLDRDSLDYLRTERLRALIEARNRRIREENAFTIYENIVQTFRIDNFGIWNIDKLTNDNSYPITAIFQDSTGKELQLKNIAVIENGVNGIYRFFDNNIRIMKNADNMLMGVLNNQIAYLSFKDFEAYNIEPGRSIQVFRMRVLPENQHNYSHIKYLMLGY